MRLRLFDSRLLKNVDYLLLLGVVGLCGLGCAMIYSAAFGDAVHAPEAQRQMLWVGAGLAIAILLMCMDYQWVERAYPWIYGINLALLAFVLKFGATAGGAQRWIAIGPFRFQPSEFAKIAFILTLAVFLNRRRERLTRFRTVIESLGHLVPPMLLIFLQPDLGTSLALVATYLGMLYIAGASRLHLGVLVALGIVALVFAWKYDFIRDYQKARLTAVIHPDSDPLRTGYQIRQAQIAIGSGSIWGKGFTKGTQNRLDFIPAQTTDFINTVIGEELGFAGSVTLLCLFLLVIHRCIDVSASTENFLGAVIAGGVASLIAFHAIVNIGMTIRLMPVTGLPLLFVSYGGSSVLMGFMAIGLVESISMRRHRLAF